MTKIRIFIILFFIGLIVSGIYPHDYFTWILEVFPGIIGFIVLMFSFKRFRFTDFTYIFILIHCYILFIGGHYTYAEVPLFDWIKELFYQSRNNYDKVGHFAQGFIPAMVVRELFVRLKIVKRGKWLSFLCVCVCLSISACYELFEWFVAVASGQSAEAFLGTQGDNWDTQSDMLFALIGAVCMVVFASGIQDKYINKISVSANLIGSDRDRSNKQ
jgi:putative membrane protein